MFSVGVVLCLCFSWYLILIVDAFPSCDTNVIYTNGIIDPEKTILNCSLNVASPTLMPNYNSKETLNITAQVVLNNLVQINAVSQLITMDVKIRFWWFDNRFNITDTLYEALNPIYASNGIDMTFMSDANLLKIWKPDIHFSDANSETILAESLRLKPHGIVYWSRHITLTFSQPTLQFSNFPMDHQMLYLRFESYAFPTTILNIVWANPSVLLYQGAGCQGYSIQENPLWAYDSSESEIYYANNAVSGSPRYFTQAQVMIKVTRLSFGVLLRFATPMLILVTLGTLVFWGNRDNRFQATVTLLLALSALYLLTSNLIPLVGYTTTFDKYSISMYSILFFCCGIHMFVSRTYLKEHNHPLRIFGIRLLESILRTIMFPMVILLFVSLFHSQYSTTSNTIIYTLISILVPIIGIREYFSLIRNIRYTTLKLIEKYNQYLSSQKNSLEPSFEKRTMNSSEDLPPNETILNNQKRASLERQSQRLSQELSQELSQRQSQGQTPGKTQDNGINSLHSSTKPTGLEIMFINYVLHQQISDDIHMISQLSSQHQNLPLTMLDTNKVFDSQTIQEIELETKRIEVDINPMFRESHSDFL